MADKTNTLRVVTEMEIPELKGYLDTTQWAMELGYEVIDVLGEYLTPVQAQEGDFVFREHDKDPFLCFLIVGRVKIVKSDQDGNSYDVLTLRNGASFGEMSLLHGEGRSASALAIKKSLLLILPKDRFAKLKEEHPEIALEVVIKIACDLSGWLRRTTGLLVENINTEQDFEETSTSMSAIEPPKKEDE